ncbi:MAG: GTP cyclohydrolase I [Polyangiaceae bacterium]|nr:GTP cyclohydrolase I [Polyangiaceae bacterium]
MDRDAAARAIRDLLGALGYDADTDPALRDTPERAVDAWSSELLSGRSVDLEALVHAGTLAQTVAAPGSVVLVRDIDVATLCPHHLLPAHGTATVAYLPRTSLLGLGTLAHLVNACARRLALQERVGEMVVEALIQFADARGAFCRLSLWHSCLALRGARQAHATVRTIAAGGELADPAALASLERLLAQEPG